MHDCNGNLNNVLRIWIVVDLCVKGAPVVVKRYSYKEIKRATDRFRRVVDSSCGEASYKAKFDDGRVGIVREVKLLDEEGDDSFVKEVWVLGRLHHRHIVALYGFSTGPKRYDNVFLICILHYCSYLSVLHCYLYVCSCVCVSMRLVIL